MKIAICILGFIFVSFPERVFALCVCVRGGRERFFYYFVFKSRISVSKVSSKIFVLFQYKSVERR